MRVMVTGGTGFVGSHTIGRLVAAGHQVCLLVRSREKIEALLARRGLEVDEIVVGDMSDPHAVAAALDGCDGVVHAAAAVGIGRGHDVFEANTAGNRHVLGGAMERGLDPIVYVSSIGAMFPPPGSEITCDDPIGSFTSSYARSKAEGERSVRALQAEGAPIVNVYPSAVLGPEDPVPGEGTKGLRDRLRYGWPLSAGGIAVIDVRDLARILVAVLEPGRGPRRFMAGGHFLTWREEADLCEELTARKVRRVPAPSWAIRTAGNVVDLIRRVVPSFDYPLTREAAEWVIGLKPCDSRATTEQLGIEFRPTRETLRDTIRWLYESGEIDAKQAGRLADDALGARSA